MIISRASGITMLQYSIGGKTRPPTCFRIPCCHLNRAHSLHSIQQSGLHKLTYCSFIKSVRTARKEDWGIKLFSKTVWTTSQRFQHGPRKDHPSFANLWRPFVFWRFCNFRIRKRLVVIACDVHVLCTKKCNDCRDINTTFCLRVIIKKQSDLITRKQF